MRHFSGTDHTIFSYAWKIALEEDVSTPPDKAVFFGSGRNRQHAIYFCQKEQRNEGYKTVLDSPAWQYLSKLRLITRDSPLTSGEQLKITDLICCRFSEAVSGNVTLFFRPERPYGTFFRLELPILLENPHVLTINEEPKEKFRAFLSYPVADIIEPDNLQF